MIKNYIYYELLQHLVFDPTPGQKKLIEELADYLSLPCEQEIFLIKGFAGTGKTSVVNALVRTLNNLKQKSVLMAPTGRAAKVMSAYTEHSAFTIHKKIYRQQSGKDGMGTFVPDRNLHKNTYFIVDEASMIGDRSKDTSLFGSGDLLLDLIEYVHSGHNCRLILLGDTAQLPPVGLDISPALDKAELESLGLRVREGYLRDVVRQEMGSGILKNATILRRMIDDNKPGFPSLLTADYPDIVRLSGVDLVEEIENCYAKYGEGETIVISRSNKRANRFNQGIRNQILWREEELSMGDYLMVVKNNYYWISEEEGLDFIANGDTVRVERIRKHHTLYDHRFVDVSLSFPDYEGLELDAMLMLDTLSLDTASLPLDLQKDFFNKVLKDYPEETSKARMVQKVIDDPYFNALQIKFAYAVTCHKAQGGQWKAVFIDPGYFKEDMLNLEYLRWLYTAFTRASKKLYLVNFPNDFFLPEGSKQAQ